MRTAMRWILATCLAGLATVGLSACGDKGSGGGGDSSSPVGAWKFDVDALMKSALDQMPAEQKKMMNDTMIKGMREMMSKMNVEVEFKSNNTTTMKMSGVPGKEDESGEGTWKLDGTKLTVQMTKKNGKAVEGDEAKPKDAVFKDGKISMQPDEPGAPAIVLIRK
jgi:hypothetical protein